MKVRSLTLSPKQKRGLLSSLLIEIENYSHQQCSRFVTLALRSNILVTKCTADCWIISICFKLSVPGDEIALL